MPNRNESLHNFDPETLRIPWLAAGGFHRRYTASSLTEHLHPDGFELTFVFSGAVRWVLGNGVSLHHPAGTLGVIQRNVPHHGGDDVIAPCGLFWLLIKSGHFQRPFFSPEEAETLRTIFENAGNVVTDGSEFFVVVLKQLMRLLQAPDAGEVSVRARFLLHTLLLEAAASLRQAQRRQERRRLDAYRMERIKEALAADLKRKIRLAELAGQHKMTPVELTRRFVRYEKLTPAEFRMRARLEAAARSLRETPELPVGELAFRLGFSSSQHFSNVFKRYYRISPRAYRTQAGAANDSPQTGIIFRSGY